MVLKKEPTLSACLAEDGTTELLRCLRGAAENAPMRVAQVSKTVSHTTSERSQPTQTGLEKSH